MAKRAETSIAARKALEGMIQSGLLKSQHPAYLGSPRSGERLYFRVLKEQTAFATAIEPIAEGMLAIARADTDGHYTSVVAPAIHAHGPYPRAGRLNNSAGMVVILNPCVSTREDLAGVSDWGLNGALRLKAVTLESGHDDLGAIVAKMGLAFRKRPTSEHRYNPHAFAVVVFDLSGYNHVFENEPELNGEAYLRYALGMSTLERTILSTRGGGTFEYCLGFPGAKEYVGERLAGLARYFIAAADHMVPPPLHD